MAKRSRPPKMSRHGREPSSKTARGYEVGYGRPPLHSRFKPGQSGNPKGGPEGPQGSKTLTATGSGPPVTMVGDWR